MMIAWLFFLFAQIEIQPFEQGKLQWQELKKSPDAAVQVLFEDDDLASIHLEKPPAGKSFHLLDAIRAVCWKCALPIYFSGKKITKEKDFASHESDRICCACAEDHYGIPISFWEPALLIEVTPTPYLFPTFGNANLGGKLSSQGKNRGSLSNSDDGGARSSFYNVHLIPFPLFRWASFLPGTECMKASDITIPWCTEFDPTWRRPELAQLMNQEMFKYATPSFQNECKKDCKAADDRKPTDEYFWCAGCLGSYYPLTGHIAHHIGGVQASALLVQRALGKEHFWRSKLDLGTGFKEGNYCSQTIFPHLQKTHYKIQLIYPTPDLDDKVACRVLGQTPYEWGKNKCFAAGGESFVYIVWKKNQCCYNVDALAKKFGWIGYLVGKGVYATCLALLKSKEPSP